MRSTHTITVRYRCQPLNVAAKKLGKNLGFDLAQLREFLSNMRDWTVVLADLGSGLDGLDRSDVAVLAERGCQQFDRRRVWTVRPQLSIALLYISDALGCEPVDGVLASGLSEMPQSGDS